MRIRETGVGRFSQVGAVGVVAVVLFMAACSQSHWPQWGGPNRDFKVQTSGLANAWSESGPQQLWSHELGSGLSSIAADGGRLFTLYRDGDDEIVVALDADSGETLWEHRYGAAIPEGIETRFSKGPLSTPTVHAGRVYTVGFTGAMHCLAVQTGKVLWTHDLVKDFGAKTPHYGFASSPTVYGRTLIAAVGGPGAGMVAFDLASGSVIWKMHDFENTYSSPIIINVGGKDQAVLLVDREIVGVCPADGTLVWRFEHVNQWKTNILTPVWGQDNLMFVSSGGDAGSRMLKLTPADGGTKVEEVWAERKIGVGQNNAIRIGDHLYLGISKGREPHLAAINAKTGEVAWEEPGYPKGQMLFADGKLIVLDEKGVLTMATVTPEGITVRSTAQVIEEKAWTIPTLVGKRLYLRNNDKIMALDLG